MGLCPFVLAELLELSAEHTEEALSGLVVSKTVFAKIDRPAGVVTFQPRKAADEVLQEWWSDNKKLMRLVAKCSHLVEKERMAVPLDK